MGRAKGCIESNQTWRRDKETMKKRNKATVEDELRKEYPSELIRSGVRGKYAKRYAEGTNVVLLAPDVASAFPTPQAVNEALRMFVKVAKSMRRS
jgi:hypothetical protein